MAGQWQEPTHGSDGGNEGTDGTITEVLDFRQRIDGSEGIDGNDKFGNNNGRHDLEVAVACGKQLTLRCVAVGAMALPALRWHHDGSLINLTLVSTKSAII